MQRLQGVTVSATIGAANGGQPGSAGIALASRCDAERENPGKQFCSGLQSVLEALGSLIEGGEPDANRVPAVANGGDDLVGQSGTSQQPARTIPTIKNQTQPERPAPARNGTLSSPPPTRPFRIGLDGESANETRRSNAEAAVPGKTSKSARQERLTGMDRGKPPAPPNKSPLAGPAISAPFTFEIQRGLEQGTKLASSPKISGGEVFPGKGAELLAGGRSAGEPESHPGPRPTIDILSVERPVSAPTEEWGSRGDSAASSPLLEQHQPVSFVASASYGPERDQANSLQTAPPMAEPGMSIRSEDTDRAMISGGAQGEPQRISTPGAPKPEWFAPARHQPVSTDERSRSGGLRVSTGSLHAATGSYIAVSPGGSDALLPDRNAAAPNSGESGLRTDNTASGGSAGLRETFASLDEDTHSQAAAWIHADARHAEAGYFDPALGGWVGVRADASSNGLHATLVPANTAGAEALGNHLGGLNAYLAEHHAAVHTTVSLLTPQSGNPGPDAGFSQGRHHQQPRDGGDANGRHVDDLDRLAALSTSAGRTGPTQTIGGAEPNATAGHISVVA